MTGYRPRIRLRNPYGAGRKGGQGTGAETRRGGAGGRTPHPHHRNIARRPLDTSRFGNDEAEEEAPRKKAASGRAGYQRETVIEAAMKSAARSVASQVANQIGKALVRGILGSLKR